MYKREYQPLLTEGFKEIAIWQLDGFFLDPFTENEQRKYLIERFNAFISEFTTLGLNAELWIDGSFTTIKPEPQDIDVLFLIDRTKVDELDIRRANLFQKLLMNREEVKARYQLDVYFIDINDIQEKEKWIETYGFDSTKLNSKGIYKINLQQDV